MPPPKERARLFFHLNLMLGSSVITGAIEVLHPSSPVFSIELYSAPIVNLPDAASFSLACPIAVVVEKQRMQIVDMY